MYRSFSDFVYEYQWPRSEFAPLRTGMSDEFRPDSAKFGKRAKSTKRARLRAQNSALRNAEPTATARHLDRATLNNC